MMWRARLPSASTVWVLLYGYGSREELTAAGACFLAEQPADIADYVLGK